MRNYGDRIEYNPPMTVEERFQDAMNYTVKSPLDAMKHYNRKSVFFKKPSEHLEYKKDRGILPKRYRESDHSANRKSKITYLNRASITPAEMKMFHDFGK